MGTKSREVIFGGRLRFWTARVESTREEARAAIKKAHRALAEEWSVRMEGFGGPAQPSPTIAQCISGGLGWLEVECMRCKTRGSLPLQHIRRPQDTPVWKLEASLRCRSCATRRYRPPVRLVKLTQAREVNPYPWDRPGNER
ncbi:hypothetical protein BJ123_108141 [Rhodopseudomonas thermotolerans]|uniref:Uncharacterized protein n=2 Tax=Rhodopseudomonas TaxID=1073 RepID=A0A336JM54_9BRAD|nr:MULTISPECIES: hypothetical protein [Rhodopseudomonas]RED36205.1 hypothetical protein BJ125_108140 [Rhodopseudomonas pentothenatexigens]REG03578.1 hypothetical protein BJ123_108141 [Rhodopseudomonas thermotolerans]SSW90765.1 hypothetical protein SAMN05892882_108140 [Rhodopseudomonas pentothenatexigens]